jgi:hypothetical protein
MELEEFEHVLVDSKSERILVRKLDRRIIPWVALLYLLSFLDRVNIGTTNKDTPFLLYTLDLLFSKWRECKNCQ